MGAALSTAARNTQFEQAVLSKLAQPVEICGRADYEQCLPAWVESFAADPPNPLFQWMIQDPHITPEEQQRRYRLQFGWIVRVGTEAIVEQGLLLGVRDAAGAVVAAAALLPPGVSGKLSALQQWWRGLEAAPSQQHEQEWGAMPGRKLACLSAPEGPVATAKQRRFEQPCWYLKFLGVQPRCQGRSHGRALLCAVCALADSQRLPVSLLCETEEHQRLYGQFGFVTLEAVTLCPEGCDSSATVHLMQRAAVGGSIPG